MAYHFNRVSYYNMHSNFGTEIKVIYDPRVELPLLGILSSPKIMDQDGELINKMLLGFLLSSDS